MWLMSLAEATAQKSNCVKRSVGAIIARDDRIISHGYNGTVRGATNCNEVFDSSKYSNATHKEWSSINEVHAEMNAIMASAKFGIAVEGATLYVTHLPCVNCTKHIKAAGISALYVKTIDNDRVGNQKLKEYIKLHDNAPGGFVVRGCKSL